MQFRSLHRPQLLAAVLFVTAVLVLAVQLITPSPVMVSIGSEGTQTTSVGEYFTYVDATILAGSALLAGCSGTYLVCSQPATERTAPPRSSQPDAPAARPTTNGGDEGRTAPNPAPESGVAAESGTASNRDLWLDRLERLTNNEATIYELLIEADGELAQRKLVDETDLSKATVSRTLDNLEHRGWVERRRNGMGNTIHLT